MINKAQSYSNKAAMFSGKKKKKTVLEHSIVYLLKARGMV